MSLLHNLRRNAAVVVSEKLLPRRARRRRAILAKLIKRDRAARDLLGTGAPKVRT